jgi:hypothetical protein
MFHLVAREEKRGGEKPKQMSERSSPVLLHAASMKALLGHLGLQERLPLFMSPPGRRRGAFLSV